MAIVIENKPINDKPVQNLTSLSVDEDGTQWAYHKVQIHNESFQASFWPEQVGTKLTVYLKQNKQPTEDTYDFIWKLPDNTSCSWVNKTKHGNDSIILFESDANEYSCKWDVYGVFLSDSENLDGVFHVGKLNS